MSGSWLKAWALGSMSLGGASLIVPLYLVELGGGPFELGLMASAAAFAGVPGALIFGKKVDKVEDPSILVSAALAITAVILFIVPLLSSGLSIIVANSVIWFAFASATPVLTLLAVSDTPSEKWVERIGQLNKYQGYGWAIGLGIGSAWLTLGSSYSGQLFVQQSFMVFLGLSTLVAVFLNLNSSSTGKTGRIDRKKVQRAVSRADRFSVRTVTFPFTVGRASFYGLSPRKLYERFTPSLLAYLFAAGLFFTGFGAFFAPLPAYLGQIGFTSGGIFLIYLISSISAAVVFGRVAALSQRFGTRKVQLVALFSRSLLLPSVTLVGGLLGAYFLGKSIIALLFLLIGVTWALISVTASSIVSELAPSTMRGEALGVYSALGALAGGIGSLLGGYISGFSFLYAYLIACGLVMMGAGVVFFLSRKR